MADKNPWGEHSFFEELMANGEKRRQLGRTICSDSCEVPPSPMTDAGLVVREAEKYYDLPPSPYSQVPDRGMVIYFLNKSMTVSGVISWFKFRVLTPSQHNSTSSESLSRKFRALTPSEHKSQRNSTPCQSYQKPELVTQTRFEVPPQRVTAILVDKRIYVFGGYKGKPVVRNPSLHGLGTGTYHNPFWSYSPDTIRPPGCIKVFDLRTDMWSQIPSMLETRVSPKLLSCGDDHIFALGCASTPWDLNIWGEYFVISQNKWFPFPPPYARDMRGAQPMLLTCATIDDTRFLTIFRLREEYLYIYDIVTKQWSSIDIPDPFPHPDIDHPLTIVVENIIYCFYGMAIYAYDLRGIARHMHLVQGIIVPSSIGLPTVPIFPFHRGENKFSFVWSPSPLDGKKKAPSGVLGPDETESYFVYCLNFTVEVVTNGEGNQLLEAKNLSFQNFPVESSVLTSCVGMAL